MTTNAPVGPPICTRDPPSAEIRNPATMAVASPRSGVTPLAIAKAIASGRATIPTMIPACRSAANWGRLYPSWRTESSLGRRSADEGRDRRSVLVFLLTAVRPLREDEPRPDLLMPDLSPFQGGLGGGEEGHRHQAEDDAGLHPGRLVAAHPHQGDGGGGTGHHEEDPRPVGRLFVFMDEVPGRPR